MGHKINILFIIIGSFGAFLYFRHTDKDHQKMDKILFVLGGVFVLAGCLIVLLLHGVQFLVYCLILKDVTISGKLILIGYMFLLISLLFFIEKQLLNLFGSKSQKRIK